MNRKLLFTFVLVIFSLGLLINNHSFTISAYSQEYKYEYACDLNYSVDYINDDGSLSNIGCYNDFASAKKKMKENNDYVVRHKDGYSPSRIVAMNSGLVYSYYRGSDSEEAIRIYEGVKGIANNSETYVKRYYQMEYIDTNYMSENSGFEGQGYVHINLGGFDGYADIEYTDLVPSKYIDNRIPIYLGGSYGGNSKSPYKTIIEPDYYTIEKNGNYNDLVLYYHNAYPDSNGNATCWSKSIGSASDFSFMNKNTRYYSPDGVNFYDSYKTNNRTLKGSGYNYYQYLPLRTKSNITDSQLNSFLLYVKGSNINSVIKNKGSVFKNAEDAYGSNAAIVFSMACWESDYGTSGYALQRNNLFGWRAYDSDPDNAYAFASVDACINQHAGGNLRDYSDYTVSWFNGSFLGNKGAGFNLKYASDPYWGAGIASIYYRLDKYASNDDGNLVDHNKYDLGVVKTFGAPIYGDANGKNVLFYCKYSNTRNLNYVVSLIEDTNDYYKIQLANPIKDGQVIAYVDGVVDYSWSKSIGYIKKSDITRITNNNAINVNVVEKEHNPITVVDSMSINDGVLSVGGVGIITNYNFDNSDNVSHIVNVYDIRDNSLIKSVNCTNTNTSWYNINDGYKYTYGGFACDIDLSDISLGTYYLTLKTSINVSSNAIVKETVLNSSDDDLHSNIEDIGTLNYKLLTNDIYNYRFELDVTKSYTQLNYVAINKPSNRSSMVAVEQISYDDTKLVINGAAMIYYLDYANEDIYHTLYLVNNDNIFEFDTASVKSTLNFKELLNSDNDLNYINYIASIDCKDIPSGSYVLVMKLQNNDKLDYYELTNDYNYTYDNLQIEGLICEHSIDSVRSRMLVKIVND